MERYTPPKLELELYTPIAIQHEWKVSEEKLKNANQYGLNSDCKEIEGFPEFYCALQWCLKNRRDENGECRQHVQISIELCGRDQRTPVLAKFVIYIKSADFVALSKESRYCIDYEAKQAPTMSELLWNRGDKDFVFVVGKENEEKTEIRIHKFVLSTWSTVFASMIKNEMKEKIEITDFDAEVVQTAVKHCYDQDIDDLVEDTKIALELLHFADKFDMKELKIFVELQLINDMSPKNICHITKAAIISNSSKLCDFCVLSLLNFLKLSIHVDHFDILDDQFAKDLVKKAFPSENC
uniref:BTB domain-containing protein n=1 Tax=Panagrolaimus sp. ES5 TaxID=591445 RepID=A0AC34FU34_9BILA